MEITTNVWVLFKGGVSIFFLYITISSVHFSHAVADESACVLNLTSYSYQPSGDCIGDQINIKCWGSLPTTLCCRTPLALLSHALAWNSVNSDADNNYIFLDSKQWQNCKNPGFQRQQDAISFDKCGFNALNLENGGACSRLSLSNMVEDQKFREALENCTGFGTHSFDEDCRSCGKAVLRAGDSLRTTWGVGRNDTERGICVVAVVTAIVAEQLDNTTVINDLYGCLSMLDEFDSGYIKVKYSVFQAFLGIVLASLGLMLVIMLVKYVSKKKLQGGKASQVETKENVPTNWSGLYRFSKVEIENAINFGGERVCLGRGSAGDVYKGILPSGQPVAIKQINNHNNSHTFAREVEGFTRIRHPNLVCLFGCCIEGGVQYLVYEYCSAGNLAKHLLRKDSVLTWDKRVRILRDCALALRYLHHNIDGCIVHRDIKLTNILLTENLDAKLADFGLAKILGMEESKVFTDVRGTIGYMDPEYMSNAKLTCASDIYSFGIVCLQLLSGQKVIELDLEARDQLTRKAKDVSMGKRPLTDFQDPKLNGNLNTVDFESILQIAVLCVCKSSKGRPTIDIVYGELDKAWQNTDAAMRAKEGKYFTATQRGKSLDVIPV